MKRSHVLIATVAAFTACLSVPLSGAAAGPPDVVCSQVTNSFTGTARDLIVPTGGYCAVTGATITHDLIQQDHAGADVSGTSVGHDVRFQNDAGAGIVSSTVGHDIVAAGDESGADVFDTAVGHDMLALGEDSGFDIAGVDGRPRRQAPRPRRWNARRASHDRARLLRVEAADGADRSDWPGHAGRPRERRSRLRDRRLAGPAVRLRWHLRRQRRSRLQHHEPLGHARVRHRQHLRPGTA